MGKKPYLSLSQKREFKMKEYIDKYLDEATSVDYDHLLGVSMDYVDVI